MSTARALPTSINQYVDAEPPTDPVLRLARVIAKEMEAIHGGKFRVQVEHGVGLVVIARKRSAERTQS